MLRHLSNVRFLLYKVLSYRWYASLGLYDVAVTQMLEILDCNHQSKATQELFLKDFLKIIQVPPCASYFLYLSTVTFLSVCINSKAFGFSLFLCFLILYEFCFLLEKNEIMRKFSVSEAHRRFNRQ